MNYLIYVKPIYDSSVGKESTCNAGDHGSIPRLGRSPREGKGYPLQYSGLENSMDCLGHGVEKVPTRLSTFTFTFKAFITGSSTEEVAATIMLTLCSLVLNGLYYPLVLLSPPPHPSKPWALS